METFALLLQLFGVFFFIGMFTFGGGYAVISLIQSEVVLQRGWIPESVFTDIIAISQVTPGPVGLNSSTFVGYDVLKHAGAGELMCVVGSVTSSFAVVIPSFLIMLLIVRAYGRFHEGGTFRSVMNALKPAVAGLIGAAAFALMFHFGLEGGAPHLELIRDTFVDWRSWMIFGIIIASYLFTKAGPITLLFAGGLAGLVVF